MNDILGIMGVAPRSLHNGAKEGHDVREQLLIGGLVTVLRGPHPLTPSLLTSAALGTTFLLCQGFVSRPGRTAAKLAYRPLGQPYHSHRQGAEPINSWSSECYRTAVVTGATRIIGGTNETL